MIIDPQGRAIAIALTVALLSACAPGPRTSVAVLPVIWRTRDAVPALEERAPLVDGMRETEVDVSAPSPDPPCEDAECARRAGLEARASRVVVTSMAGLGETVLTRVTVIDVSDGTTEQTQQRVLRSVDVASVTEALRDLGHTLGETIAPSADGTFAIVLGTSAAVAVAAGVAIALGVALGADQSGPDHTVVPP